MSFYVSNSSTIFPGTRLPITTAVRSRADLNYTSSTFTGNGVTVAFTVTFPILVTSLSEFIIFVDRKRLVNNVDYSLTGSVITFTVAPRNNAFIKAIDVPIANATAFRGLVVTEGLNARQGLVTLSGTSTSTDVFNTTITSASKILLMGQQDSTGVEGYLRVVSRVPGVKFTIASSSATDNSIVAYQIFEPVLPY